MLHSLDSSATGLPPVDTNAMCRRHWPALRAAAMRRGCDVHVAEDAVQDLFCGLIRRGQLHRLGGLPAEHQTARLALHLRHQMANRWRDAHRVKRGGSITLVPLWNEDGTPIEIADDKYSTGVLNARERRLALCGALRSLRAEMKPSTWNQIAPWLVLGPQRKMKMSGALRVALHRARVRLRELMTESL